MSTDINNPMNICAYTIVTEKTITNMVKRVKDYIDSGWQPLGGVQVTIENGETVYVQTVVQYYN